VSSVFDAAADGGALVLFAAGGALDGVVVDVEGLVSALSFAGVEGVGCDEVAPDLLGASLASLDAFAGADFSCEVEVLDLDAGSLESDSAFDVGFFSWEDFVSWKDFDRLSGSLVSEAAFEGCSVVPPALGLAALGCSFNSF
jgi:hypothetical protein